LISNGDEGTTLTLHAGEDGEGKKEGAARELHVESLAFPTWK